jgi:hypothetical protein
MPTWSWVTTWPLWPRCTPERFAQLRWRAEAPARSQQWKHSGTTEITTWEIHEQFEGVTVANVERQVLVELELRCERELRTADLGMVDRRRRGPSVAPASPTRVTKPRALA